MGGIINAINVSSRGLSAQRAKMNAIAQNMANADTVETSEGGPYKRKQVVLTERKNTETFNSLLKKANSSLTRTNSAHRSGHQIKVGERIRISSVNHEEVQASDSEFRLVYDPSHPAANEEGYVKMPDIEIINEMVDMMIASRAYEANTAVIATAKGMAKDALDI